ncbi:MULTISPECIES: sel1 repeat family protein [unclassified Caballeronia]|uniref:SEL1-like repeat protein n=1 Tax=unclassified Caballeronia TaxID=2646786 RepID=UPI002859A2B3|nr:MULTISPECIES: sel1 repeat family protein [unclassified Caballeronia]MDR5751413.1 sel1 repeat family protein [Caballeronia sp. LZ024]MDR5844445.1 sel1 repeat family protein [Caballeronia sp. LZ031]
MKKITSIAICLALALCACSNKDNPMPTQAEWSAVRAQLAFTCVHEADHLPPLDPQADTLFKYALFLEKKPGPKDYDSAARYYRIAAAYGHYKANHNLQLLVSAGQASSPHAATEAVDLAEQLIAAGIPGGYYDMGHYLQLGYGVKQDEKKARIYIRKAADLGSREAQYYVGDLLSGKDHAPDISRQMMECAVDQGYGKAGSYLGIDLMNSKLYAESVNAFQKGARAGDVQSAFALQYGFDTGDPSNIASYIGQSKDPERSRRYELIWKFLDSRDGLNPKVPDIDQIVPLPPAKLPEWDGTFQWQKEQDAAKPPQKPDDKLVERLAREKRLDPATGLPLTPVKSAKAERVPLGTVARTGEVCPQDGVWHEKQWASVSYDAIRRFSKGETMPQLVVNNRRPIPGLDALLGMRVHRIDAIWSLVSYDEQA